MTKILEIPEFKSEAEEADWWDRHPDALLAVMKSAKNAGTRGKGLISRRATATATSIRLDPADIALARTQAAERGLRYQTYLKSIIRQALLKEAAHKA